ncbi:1563_t:CDS:2 [Scutellospora calospora]|uniref:1563_t:CDS:1 n=1 Tax=Scutellospora calospora TaxID=85575 RepID=A0ACA9K7F8_9GLOM|nr:1563_t:CDS:2 [Scutellospora calospora]
MFLLEIIAATKQSEIFRNSKKSKLTTRYTFKGKAICLNIFKIIYRLEKLEIEQYHLKQL